MGKRNLLFAALLIFFCIGAEVNAFNLDLSNFIRHVGEPGSMFGFSVAVHRSSAQSIRNWVIVGAPKFNGSSYQHEIIQPGGVFKCDLLDDNRCVLVPFDSKGNQRNDRGEQIDTKSHQWMGATVSSGGENGPIIACAPRYIFHTMQPSRVERIEPVGTCFTTNDFTTFTEFSPCRTNYWGYHRQGYCQAGFSAAVTKKNDRLFIGAPGSWYWQGQVYSINPSGKFPYKPPMYQEFGAGQMFAYDVTNPTHKVYATGESYSSDDDSYFGYSVTAGDFNGNGQEGLAVGMPRGSNLLGKVAIYSWNMVNQLNITGRQIGAYFGYTLCTVDVDGDKLDDLVVGAPMHAEPNNEGKYDVGRIYVFLQGRTNKFSVIHTRDGINSKGRFGLSVASLQDVNLDGFGDFAVGAPYDGPNGRGAVYIFYGSKNGPLQKHSQVIYAEDLINQPFPHTFGFSLAGGLDLDGNLYPDLAVGAYDSAAIFVFKSRPVAVVDASAKFSSGSKLISLDDKRCSTYRDNKPVACTLVTSCLKYNGLNLPEVLDFEVSWVLDSKKTYNPRMFFLLDEGKNIRNSTFRLERGKILCRNETVYLLDGFRDKLTPLEVEMRYQLRADRSRNTAIRRPRDTSLPIIDQNRDTIQHDSINIQKNCGPDNECIPNLVLEINTVKKYLLGSKEPLEIEVTITNLGEDAFEASFYMTIPSDLDYKKVQHLGDSRDAPLTCTAPSTYTNFTLKCDIGNPLPSKKIAKFKVIMIPSRKSSGMAPSYDFYMEVNSTNPEPPASRFDNFANKSIGIWIKTDLSIEGKSLPEFEHYKVGDYKSIDNSTTENDLGPHVVHIYNIRNNGPSIIEQAEIYIFWPYETHGGDQLMYLLNNPEVDGNIYCDPNIYVNERDLKLDPALSHTSYLESIGAVVRQSSSATASQQHQGSFTSTSTTGGSFHVDHSSGSSINRALGERVLTQEERRKLQAEENLESTGDASAIHTERAKAAAATGGTGAGASSVSSSSSSSSSMSSSGGNGRTNFEQHGYHTSSDGGAFISGGNSGVHTSSWNKSTTYDAYGNPVVVESSTEYYSGYNQPREYHVGSSSSSSSSPGQQFGGHVSSQGSDHRQYNAPSTYYDQSGSQNAQYGGSSGNYYQSGNTHNQPSSSYQNQQGNYYASSANNLEKAAQGNQGFQAGFLDLSDIHRPNVDDEIRNRHYSGGHSSSNSGNTQYFSSSSQGRYPSTQHGYEGEGNQNSNYYEHTTPRYRQSRNQDNINRNPQALAEGDNLNRIDELSSIAEANEDEHQRLKRQTRTEIDPELANAVHCKATRCAMLRCVSGVLGNNDGAWIAIRTRLIAHTMHKVSAELPLNISTMAVARVIRLPFIGAPKEKPIKSHEIFYKAIPEPKPETDVVPLWVVVLSACAGALILLLLVFLLYKCGFFKRNRPSDSQERQPLNSRNGGYHGDEHL